MTTSETDKAKSRLHSSANHADEGSLSVHRPGQSLPNPCTQKTERQDRLTVTERRAVDFSVRITVKTFEFPFKPRVRSYEFSFCAESREVAMWLASANVETRGYPFDEKRIQVLRAIPVFEEAQEIKRLDALAKDTNQLEDAMWRAA